jgi:hypothetical protein
MLLSEFDLGSVFISYQFVKNMIPFLIARWLNVYQYLNTTYITYVGICVYTRRPNIDEPLSKLFFFNQNLY